MGLVKQPLNIGKLLRKWRLVNDLNLRVLSKEIGIGTATLMRIEHGQSCDQGTMMKLLNWLFK